MLKRWCVVSPSQVSKRSAAVVLVLSAALSLAGCGGNDSPFGDPNAPAPTAPHTPAVATTAPPASSTPVAPLEPLPTTPAQVPSPTGTTPSAPPKGKKPSDMSAEELVAADQTAMLNARTMVSVIEGCHSGRESYRDCNSHEELGDPATLGLDIGKKPGEVQISATENGFRVTAYALSGAKFTVARGPKGDRFKCIASKFGGACPEDRTWSW